MTTATTQTLAERGAAFTKAMRAFTDAYAAEMTRRGTEFAREVNAALDAACKRRA